MIYPRLLVEPFAYSMAGELLIDAETIFLGEFTAVNRMILLVEALPYNSTDLVDRHTRSTDVDTYAECFVSCGCQLLARRVD